MLRTLRRIFGAVIAILSPETDLFDAYRQTSYHPDLPWSELADQFRSLSIDATRHETARPAIAGTRITWDWLKSIGRRECLYRFRFFPEEIHDLAVAMGIPETIQTESHSVFTRVEALCILLARFRSAGDLFELSMKYNRSNSAISEIINELTVFLDDKWYHLLEFDTNGLLTRSRMQIYADAIYAAGSPLRYIWGFIDCIIRCMCHPSWWQRQAYNGHKKVHANKFQAVKLPDGMTGHLFGPVEGRRNDNHLLAELKLLGKCTQYALRPGADDNTPIKDRYLQLFGDPAYGVSPLMLSPFSGPGERTDDEAAWNAAMAAVRIEVEHGFGDITCQWPFLNAWWKHRVYSSPIGRYYRVAVLLTNALNCLRPNQTSTYFDCEPPLLEEYFHTE